MDWLANYFIDNFILLVLSVIMVIIAIQRYKQHPKISVCTISIIFIAIILSITNRVQEYGRVAGYPYLALTMGILGYTLRPVCIFLVIVMDEKIVPKKLRWLTALPLWINLVIYLLSYIPGTGDIIFGYGYSEIDGVYHFTGGFLRFSSHVVSALYLLFLLYISFANLRAKHMTHALAVLICAISVVVAVIIEVLDSYGSVQLLNVTIVTSTAVYYLFLYMERTQIDTLSGLFNREMYYRDVTKMSSSATGVIQFDMNGLKYINDNFGHLEGDKALRTIANSITKSVKRNMYAYRLGGDEFLVIANGGTEEDIKTVVERFKSNLKDTNYHCSTGYAYRKDKSIPFTDLLVEAEKNMYLDKEEFYKTSKIERRRGEKA